MKNELRKVSAGFFFHFAGGNSIDTSDRTRQEVGGEVVEILEMVESVEHRSNRLFRMKRGHPDRVLVIPNGGRSYLM